MSRKENPVCLLCPKTLCTDFGNGYWATKDYAEDTYEYKTGTIYDCEIRAEYAKDGMYSGDDGTVYIQFRSVQDVIDEIKGGESKP